LAKSLRQDQPVRRPVFPPSEHSSLSELRLEGLCAGKSSSQERHSMPFYEHVFLTRQDASSQQVEDLTTQFKGVIEQMGGKVAKAEQWGLKSLSYRLKKNRKAHFTFFNIEAPPTALNEIERQERLSEDVLRYLTIRVDEHEEGPSAMMRKADREREREERGFGFRDRDRGGFRERGEHRRDRDRSGRESSDEAPAELEE
jgi:small subunit ribosomal protein S6